MQCRRGSKNEESPGVILVSVQAWEGRENED